MMCAASKKMVRIPAVNFDLEHQAQGTAVATRRLYCCVPWCMVAGHLIPDSPGPIPLEHINIKCREVRMRLKEISPPACWAVAPGRVKGATCSP